MPDNPEIEQAIGQHLTAADIVHHLVALSILRFFVHHNADMRNAAAEVPAHEVSGAVIRSGKAERKRFSVPLKKRHEVGYAAVVDVSVGTLHAPDFGIEAEMGDHVFVHELLEVDAQLAVSADHYVGTHATACWHVAVGVGHGVVGRVVDYLLVGEVEGGCGQAVGEGGLRLKLRAHKPNSEQNDGLFHILRFIGRKDNFRA